jgi:hypothetical protein
MKLYFNVMLGLCLGLIVNAAAFAQNNTTAKTETEKEKSKPEKPFAYVGYTGGLSVPFGDFADKVKGEDFTGYAMVGGIMRLRYHLPIGRKGFGIGFGYCLNINPTDAQAIANNFAVDLPNEYIKTYTHPYVVQTFALGLAMTSKIGERFHLDGWINIAGAIGAFPLRDYKIIGGNADATMKSTKTGWGIGNQFGLAFRFDLFERVGLMIEAEWARTVMYYDYYLQSEDLSLYRQYSGSQTQDRLNFSAGIAVRIGRN